jgi:hypothetical protein
VAGAKIFRRKILAPFVEIDKVRASLGYDPKPEPMERPMQYMLLIYGAPEVEPQYGTPAFDKMMAGYAAFSKRLVDDGAMRGGEGLQGIETATTLRVRGGKVETMDGPFATTKEHLGGYYVIDVPDLDAALKYAAMIPSATYGSVEVRPLMNYNPAGT